MSEIWINNNNNNNNNNKLAHTLDRRAVSSADFDVWVEELPSDLEDVFLSDFSALT